MEVNPEMKAELYEKFHQQLEDFLRRHDLRMTTAIFSPPRASRIASGGEIHIRLCDCWR